MRGKRICRSNRRPTQSAEVEPLLRCRRGCTCLRGTTIRFRHERNCRRLRSIFTQNRQPTSQTTRAIRRGCLRKNGSCSKRAAYCRCCCCQSTWESRRMLGIGPWRQTGNGGWRMFGWKRGREPRAEKLASSQAGDGECIHEFPEQVVSDFFGDGAGVGVAGDLRRDLLHREVV